MQNRSHIEIRKLTTIAMLTAIAFLIAFIRIPTGLAFLRYEPKDIIIAISGFIYGPLAVVTMSIVLSFLEMLFLSTTGWWGMLMNIVATCTFAGTAAVIYKKWRTLGGAAVALVAGVVVNVPVMLLWNYFVVPFYMGIPRSAAAAMLVPVFLPFNLIKGGINSAMIMLLYKPIRTALGKSRLLPANDNAKAKASKVNWLVIIISAFLLITCVLFVLSFRDII